MMCTSKIFLLLILFSFLRVGASLRSILAKDLSIKNPLLVVGAAIGSEIGAYQIDQFNEPRINEYLSRNITRKLQYFLIRCCEYYGAQSIVNTFLIPYQIAFVLKPLTVQNVLIGGACDFVREQDYKRNKNIFSNCGNEKWLHPLFSMIGNVEYQMGRAYLDTYTFKKQDMLGKLICAAISYSVARTLHRVYWQPIQSKIDSKMETAQFK